MKPIQEWTTADLMQFLKSVDQRTWIKVGVGSLIFGVVFVWIIWPAWFERFEVMGKIKSVEGQLKKIEVLRKSQPAMLESKKQMSAFIAQTKARFFNPGETSLLLGHVSRLAQEAEISVVASSPRDVGNAFPLPFANLYEAKKFDIIVEGGYHKIGKFIALIEKNPKILRLENFHLRPKESDPYMQIADLSISTTVISDPLKVPRESKKAKKRKRK